MFERIHNDRLGVLKYLKPGEQTSTELAEAAAEAEAAPAAGRPWNPKAPAPARSALKHVGMDEASTCTWDWRFVM